VSSSVKFAVAFSGNEGCFEKKPAPPQPHRPLLPQDHLPPPPPPPPPPPEFSISPFFTTRRVIVPCTSPSQKFFPSPFIFFRFFFPPPFFFPFPGDLLCFLFCPSALRKIRVVVEDEQFALVYRARIDCCHPFLSFLFPYP